MPTLAPYAVSESIRHYKSKYARAVDTKQWALFASVLHPSLTASLHNTDGSTNSFSSRDEYVEFLDKAFADIASIHVVGAGELEMLHNEDKNGEDEVAATWAMSYQLGSAEGARGYTEIGGGHYHEVWKRLDGQWVIASLKLSIAFGRFFEGPRKGLLHDQGINGR